MYIIFKSQQIMHYKHTIYYKLESSIYLLKKPNQVCNFYIITKRYYPGKGMKPFVIPQKLNQLFKLPAKSMPTEFPPLLKNTKGKTPIKAWFNNILQMNPPMNSKITTIVKVSGLGAISAKLYSNAKFNNVEGILFKQNILYNMFYVIYVLFGTGPIETIEDLMYRIRQVTMHYTNVMHPVDNMMRQHCLALIINAIPLDTSYLHELFESEVFLQTRGYLLQDTSLEFVAINPDNITAAQKISSAACYAIMKQPFSDFSLKFNAFQNTSTLQGKELFYDVKMVSNPGTKLSCVKGQLSLTANENEDKEYTMRFLGDLGGSASQKAEHMSIFEKTAISHWKHDIMLVRQETKNDPDPFRYKAYLRHINNRALYHPDIKNIIASELVQSIENKTFTNFYLANKIHIDLELKKLSSSLDIDTILPQTQLVDLRQVKQLMLTFNEVFPFTMRKDIVDNFYTISQVII